MTDKAKWKSRATQEFDGWAETYDQSILQKLLFNRCYLKFMELIVSDQERFGSDGGSLLDIGCGTGTFAAMAGSSDLNIYAVGLDMSSSMCSVAEQKARNVGLGRKVSFLAGDSEHLPFGDGTFDVITCSNSFHHYPHQRGVLAEIYRVLKPGGRIIIIDGFRDNVIGWFIFDFCVASVEKTVHHCSGQELADLLRDGGFEEIYQEKFGLWVPVLASSGIKPKPD